MGSRGERHPSHPDSGTHGLHPRRFETTPLGVQTPGGPIESAGKGHKRGESCGGPTPHRPGALVGCGSGGGLGERSLRPKKPTAPSGNGFLGLGHTDAIHHAARELPEIPRRRRLMTLQAEQLLQSLGGFFFGHGLRCTGVRRVTSSNPTATLGAVGGHRTTSIAPSRDSRPESSRSGREAILGCHGASPRFDDLRTA